MQKCMTTFDWDSLRYFLAVQRTGWLPAAGELLKVNQSTVGRRLAALEDQLGSRLFDNGPDGYRLSAAGEAMLPRAERVEDELYAAARELSGRETRLSGSI